MLSKVSHLLSLEQQCESVIAPNLAILQHFCQRFFYPVLKKSWPKQLSNVNPQLVLSLSAHHLPFQCSTPCRRAFSGDVLIALGVSHKESHQKPIRRNWMMRLACFGDRALPYSAVGIRERWQEQPWRHVTHSKAAKNAKIRHKQRSVHVWSIQEHSVCIFLSPPAGYL